MPFVFLLACAEEPTGPLSYDDSLGLLGEGRLNPFPSIHLLDDDGHVDVPIGELPVFPTRMPVERLSWRDGFSPAQVSVLHLPEVSQGDLPSWFEPTPGEGGVLLADLTAREFLPVMAEVDANKKDNPEPALLIRPLSAMAEGHQVAVVVKTSVASRPERFDALLSDDPPADFNGFAEHYLGLLDDLAAMGVDREDVALAWDFPIGDGVRPLVTAIPEIAKPESWEVTLEKNADVGDSVSTSTFRYLEGTFEASWFLGEDGLLNQDETGAATPLGTASVKFYASIPLSVADAEPGTVPILFFGHGMQSRPDIDMDAAGTDTLVTMLAEDLGVIVLATAWRGLDWDDRPVAIGVANDFGRFPEISEHMIQGQCDLRSLIRMVQETDFLSDPSLAGRDGQALGDGQALYFYGLSMGAIEGAVFLAHEPPVRAGVSQLSGGAWSTMLERSQAWNAFEPIVVDSIPDPLMRQQLYSAAQLWWDPVDPVAYADELSGVTFLMQESVGDDMIPNLGTEILARSIGMPVLSPSVRAPYGLTEVAADLPAGSRALVQLDPGTQDPKDKNRPADYTGAHTIPIGWPGVRQQVVDYLTPGSEGQVNHHCGADPCNRYNRGEEEE